MNSRKMLMRDRISELPDEILAVILSRLTLREAVGTCVLSHRWKGMWAYTTGSLDFELGSKVLALTNKIELFEILESERARYVKTVSKVLNEHKGITIEAFRVAFDLVWRDKSDIDSWIKIALEKRVQRLELDSKPAFLREIHRREKLYTFPAGDDPNISCLRSLSLYSVNVTSEVLEYLLSNCPFLEFLSVTGSTSLGSTKILAPCPKLKHLEISCCLLNLLDIFSAENLRSLTYYGSGVDEPRLCFSNVPNLTDISLGGPNCTDIIERFNQIHISFSQIKKLTFRLDTVMFPEILEFPELNNVKELELKLDGFHDRSLLSLASLMEACPNVYRFSMQFSSSLIPEKRELERRENCSVHKCLKVVELMRFSGTITEIEVANYLLSNAPVLKKIFIQTLCPLFSTITSPGRYMVENVFAKSCARQLAEQLSPAAELVIL